MTVDRAAAVGHLLNVAAAALDSALVAVALADAGDVHAVAGGEHGGVDLVAHIQRGGVIKLELLEDAQGLADLLAVAQFGLVQLALGDFLKSQLDGGVAVLLLGLLLHHGAGARLNDGDRDDLAGFVEDLGHTQLLADNGLFHLFFLLKGYWSGELTIGLSLLSRLDPSASKRGGLRC